MSRTGIDEVPVEAPASLGSILQRGYGGRRVLVTGHTGFVGTWLCQLLTGAGAEVTGLALDPEPGSLAEHLGCSALAHDARGDVRDTALVADLVAKAEPDVVFHLAAQALVLPSFADPLGTFTTNVLGTANLLEALRRCDVVRACVVVTSDKCYALGERGHCESDPLGGEDPYSASKACAERVAHAYSRSYWAGGSPGVATARAGNIIGGGDVAVDRVLPDCARAALAGEPVRLRHPGAIRPWQHVLDALAGYLRLGEALARRPTAYSGAWNFGPDAAGSATVGEVVELFQASWSRRVGTQAPGSMLVPASPAHPERRVLTLDSSKASRGLGWSTVLDLATAVDWTVEIYEGTGRCDATPELLGQLVRGQLEHYLALEDSLRQPVAPLAGIRPAGAERGMTASLDLQVSSEETTLPVAELRTPRELRSEILDLVAAYVAATQREEPPFAAGRSVVRYAGRVFDADEMINLVAASLDFWLTEGRYAARLERALCRYLGVGFCRLVNSGSSANLVAFSTLTSAKLADRRVRPGDEVITVAAGFPTTVAPLVQYGAVPVFVDIDRRTANVEASALDDALSGRTRAVMLAHTLGNPFDIDAVVSFCQRHELWLVEDNCDALGSTYTSHLGATPQTRLTGTFGDLATSSFYPPHHMTTGEGGAVYTSSEELDAIAASFRDWGRDCYCKSGKDNTCGIRFEHQLGSLPAGYDHKYIYSHFGYNLKMTDLQAAIGVAQVAKLDAFGASRRANHARLRQRLAELDDVLEVAQPTPGSDPSWFGYLMTVREDAPFTRAELVAHLEAARVQTRMLFAGNLLRHPCFEDLDAVTGAYRVVGDLRETDRLMERAFWIGVYPGMSEVQLDYMAEQTMSFCRGRGSRARHAVGFEPAETLRPQPPRHDPLGHEVPRARSNHAG